MLAIVAWVGAVTALMAAMLACAQNDIKRVLAYSTVSQLGYMMTAIGAGFAAAGFFHCSRTASSRRCCSSAPAR